jgi:transposase
MRFDLDNLPSDIAVLHRLIRDMAAVVEHHDDEIERLRLIIRKLQRAQFGRRSERIEADRFELALDDLNTDLAAAESRAGEMEAAVELSAEGAGQAQATARASGA